MRIAVLVKQVPMPESLELGADGRLRRTGVELEMNAYCRRAVSTGVRLATESGGRCVVVTLGPDSAEDVLREAVAWGADEGLHVCDAVFAGSDTLATARALAAVVAAEGPFDLVLTGRNSIDADTGQVGPQVAALLDLPFVAGVRELALADGVASVHCELDDGWRDVEVRLPAVLSTAERLCEPAKVPPEGRLAVPAARLRRLTATDVGRGPWGEAASRTVVGSVRVLEPTRRGVVLEGDVASQVGEAVSLLAEWGAIGPPPDSGQTSGATNEDAEPVPAARSGPAPADAPRLAVVIEPDRTRLARELLGEAAHLAARVGGVVVALDLAETGDTELSGWGADRVVRLTTGDAEVVEEDVAEAVAGWCTGEAPWAVLMGGTLWGREVAARVSVALDAGLVGDAVGFGVDDGRLVAWKPAFGGQLVAAITATSPVQLATVRPGVLPLRAARTVAPLTGAEDLPLLRRGRVTPVKSGRDDDVEALLTARVVVAVGAGVAPEDYDALVPLTEALGAELGASRKVTDEGWLPRARQIGVTGHSVAPALYVAIGVSGKFNHLSGARGAGVIVAVNPDRSAPVFGWADIGMVAHWQEVVPALAAAVREEQAVGRPA